MKTLIVKLFLISILIISSAPLLNAHKAGTESRESALGPYFSSLSISVPTKVVKAPDFSLKDLDGKTVSLKDYRGSVIFLNFWATWCGPCRAEMPSMEELHQTLGPKGLKILAVDLGESHRQVSNFKKRLGLTFTTLLDSKQEVGAIYGIRAIPTTYIINGEGEIIGVAMGARDWSSNDSIEMFRLLLRKNGRG